MRLRAGAAAFLIFPSLAGGAEAADCGREAFAAVVGQVGAELAALNDSQKKIFQDKLAQLKTRQGWSDADYVAKATPFVQDTRIAAFDESNKALLGKIPQLGAGAAQAPALAGAIPSGAGPEGQHCAMLAELRGLMAGMVENTRAKWGYMVGKVDAALDAARQAKAGH